MSSEVPPDISKSIVPPSRSLQKVSELKLLLDRVRKSPEMRSFFKKLWVDDLWKSFFFAHRETLFAHAEEGKLKVPFPIFFYDTLPEGDEHEQVQQVVDAALENRTAEREALTESFSPMLDGAIDDLKALACFLMLRFVKLNNSLASLLSTNFSYSDLKQTISRSKLSFEGVFSEFEEIEKYWTEDSSEGSGDPVLAGLIKKYTEAAKRALRSGVISAEGVEIGIAEMLKFVDLVGGFAPVFATGHVFVDYLLKIQSIERKEYKQIFTEFYLSKLISSVVSAFVCMRCQDEPVLLTSASRLSPSHLELGCPKCKRKMFGGAIYKPHPLLQAACFHKDGLLGVAVGFLLSDKKIEFSASAHRGRHETDFIVNLGSGSVLLECKMHKQGKDRDAVQGHLVRDLTQAIEHAADLERNSAKPSEVWIVTNYESAPLETLFKQVTKGKASEVKRYHISFVDASDFPGLLGKAQK